MKPILLPTIQDRRWTVTKSDHPVNEPYPTDKETDDRIYTRCGKLTADEAVKLFAEYCLSIDSGTVQLWDGNMENGKLYI